MWVMGKTKIAIDPNNIEIPVIPLEYKITDIVRKMAMDIIV